MVLLALGLSSITAPTTEAVMGSVPDEQRGAAAGVNNTTRELGGTLGVAVFGSIFASAYAPRIISAFRPLPIPAGPKAEAHQSMAAALAVVKRAPARGAAVPPAIGVQAFHSGLHAACIAGAVVAVVGRRAPPGCCCPDATPRQACPADPCGDFDERTDGVDGRSDRTLPRQPRPVTRLSRARRQPEQISRRRSMRDARRR